MPDQSSSLPSKRQPKLRSSCDGCGMAKLRCDRAQPECGRCVSYGLPCVYGVSRRMGKAPGRGRRTSVTQGTTSVREAGATGTEKRESNNNNNSSSSSNKDNVDNDAVMMDLGLFSNFADIPTSHEIAGGSADALINNYLHGPSLLNLSSLDFDTKIIADDYSNDFIPFDFQTGLTYTQESPEIADYSSTSASTTQPITIQPKTDRKPQSDTDFNVPTTAVGHPCYADAYDILRTLSQLRISNDPSFSSLHSTKAVENANWVPFDHLLSINRETSERLSTLLDCACARSSHLTLLHASIICRVLTLYQQAVACTQDGSGGGAGLWNPATATVTIDPSSHYLSPTWSSPEGVSASLGTGPPTTGSSTKSTIAQQNNLTITPAKMAVGVFNVDDQRVQSAVNIQLVLGEMRRTEHLIDQFTSREFNGTQHLEDDGAIFGSGAVDNLCRSLESWLRGEHSRIVNVMRSQLRKLNT